MPRKDLLAYPKRVGYRKHAGMLAWLLHRATALILVLYFIFHILGSSGVCSFLPAIVQNNIVKSVMIVAFIFHALNGIRIMMMEFGDAAERDRFNIYFYIVLLLTVVLSSISIYIAFGGMI